MAVGPGPDAAFYSTSFLLPIYPSDGDSAKTRLTVDALPGRVDSSFQQVSVRHHNSKNDRQVSLSISERRQHAVTAGTAIGDAQ